MKNGKIFHNLLTENETSEYVGMSISFLRQSRIHGGSKKSPAPPFIKIGRSVRYLVKDLDEWIEKRRVDIKDTDR